MINYSWWLIRVPPILIYGLTGEGPPSTNSFLLLDNTFFLLLDGENLALL